MLRSFDLEYFGSFQHILDTLQEPFIRTRQRCLYFGTPAGTDLRNHSYTFFDSFGYLRDVLTRLPTIADAQLPELLPDGWIAGHPHHRLEHREREANQARTRRKNRRARRRELARAKSKSKPK